MLIRVKVITGAKKETIKKIEQDTYAVSIKEKPERNEANRKIVEIISLEYDVPKNKIQMITGHKSKSKILCIRD